MKKYIVPALTETRMMSQTHILAGSLKLNDDTVTEGWTKQQADWDIFGDGAEADEE